MEQSTRVKCWRYACFYYEIWVNDYNFKGPTKRQTSYIYRLNICTHCNAIPYISSGLSDTK